MWARMPKEDELVRKKDGNISLMMLAAGRVNEGTPGRDSKLIFLISLLLLPRPAMFQ